LKKSDKLLEDRESRQNYGVRFARRVKRRSERTLPLVVRDFHGATVATSTMGHPTKRGSISSAIVWMFLLEILLFWIPFAGSFVAGFVGGRKAGDLGNAVVAVFLPIVVFRSYLV
jgi:hypothetical protein